MGISNAFIAADIPIKAGFTLRHRTYVNVHDSRKTKNSPDTVPEDRIRDDVAELNRTSTQRMAAAELYYTARSRELLSCPYRLTANARPTPTRLPGSAYLSQQLLQ